MLAGKDGFQPPVETPDARLKWLSLQDKDGVWHKADGTIVGSDLVVSCKDVKQPVAVRYAYTTHPTGTLLVCAYHGASGESVRNANGEFVEPGK
jgi:hypothetical protein